MSKLEQRKIQRDLSQAERSLMIIAVQQGKESPQYCSALQHFARLWELLVMTRSQNEFFAEISS
jgi:hypothetical protein